MLREVVTMSGKGLRTSINLKDLNQIQGSGEQGLEGPGRDLHQTDDLSLGGRHMSFQDQVDLVVEESFQARVGLM